MNRAPVLAVVAAGVAALGLGAVLHPSPRLVWNASPSAPVGLWRIDPGAPIAVGDMVLAQAPDAARRLAAARGYLPQTVPLVKAVAAAEGDSVCAEGAWMFVGATRVAHRLRHDAQGRPLPWWRGCRRLARGEYLLISPAETAFDSRYFGPVEASAVIGRARPLWTR